MMDFTVEENKKRQKNGDIRYIDKKAVKLHLHIYKLGKLKDVKELTFSNDERCMIHIENLIKTTDYNLHAISTEKELCGKKTYYITLRK
ncbi:hypothetical protein H3018_gp03 [Bacillus phage DK3]|uniref:Uncharacterized protein n=2 Tax=Hemphillvirus TaxID=2842725 RepID=A0A3T0IIV0_9CAUD|nr:hypothetical protein H3017_gp02 [Bacillus phage DK2]YP_009910493.1 hypothetical protein H3018_gp03 [Bacillus phage DK3]AZU99755.1 hypothetical protein DK2_00002 [Bacillus phage DK2]AZU99801.1 hypothetical protein DK3_00003 [Bacillus phage DK3]